MAKMTDWSNFYIAVASASATLTGLVFVGVSISLTKILSVRGLTDRALISLMLLLNILILSLLFLVPQQPASYFGREVLLLGILVWIVIAYLDRRVFQSKQKPYKLPYTLYILIDQTATISYIVAGVLMMTGDITGGYWMTTAILISLIKAVIDAWALLVEINR